MKASDYIISFFEQNGVKYIFGYIGGMITHLVDSIYTNHNVNFIQTYHEQTAAIAAEGYAICSNNIGVAISTSGPGATNMITGIADAYFDSIPVIYITGQVNTYEYKYDKPIRQQGFQETDIIDIVKPITKYAKLIDNPNDLRYELEKALYIAVSGRKGPVLLDIPMDIQRAEVNPLTMVAFQTESSIKYDIDISKYKDLIEKSKRPMLLVGGGCKNIEVKQQIENFIRKYPLPVITSLMGKGCIDENNDYYLGIVGSYGNRCANMCVSNADFLLVLGSRLDTRQTGAKYKSFLPDSTIIHVDIDNEELEHHRICTQIKVNCDVLSFMDRLNSYNIDYNVSSDWLSYVQKMKSEYSQENEVERFVENKIPYTFMQYLNSIMRNDDIVCTDVGQNQVWAAQIIRLSKNQTYLTSGGLAPMGYSMPSAIGCSFAEPEKVVYSITGDGGFHMSLQSLPLISQYKLPIKVAVFNNRALGMITQFQHLYFEDRLAGTVSEGGYYSPDIENLAKAYKIKYFRITKDNILDDNLKSEISRTKTCVLEFVIDGITTVSPKLEYNKPISKPTPQLPDDEFDYWEKFLKK